MTFLPQQQMGRRFTAAILVVAAAAFSVSAQAAARSHFDGGWSVSIVTEKGECDRGYRYPIAINDGVLMNAGDTAFDISGNVAANGSVTVRVAYGSKAATGRGRLSGTYGEGWWTAESCTGTWTAERRR